MDIDWAALGSVFGVSLVVTVALVGFFTLGIVGLSKASSGAQGGGSGVAAKAAWLPLLRALRGGGRLRDLHHRGLRVTTRREGRAGRTPSGPPFGVPVPGAPAVGLHTLFVAGQR